MAKRILIVDDEPNIVVSLDYLMKREGYETTIAVTPRRPPGRDQTARSAASVARRGRAAGTPAPPPSRRASRSGSGRSITSTAAATIVKAATEPTNKDGSAG